MVICIRPLFHQKRCVLYTYMQLSEALAKPSTTDTAKGTHRYRCVHSAIPRCTKEIARFQKTKYLLLNAIRTNYNCFKKLNHTASNCFFLASAIPFLWYFIQKAALFRTALYKNLVLSIMHSPSLSPSLLLLQQYCLVQDCSERTPW